MTGVDQLSNFSEVPCIFLPCVLLLLPFPSYIINLDLSSNADMQHNQGLLLTCKAPPWSMSIDF